MILRDLIAECEKTNPKIIIEGLEIILDSNIQMRKELAIEGRSIRGVEFLNDKIKKQKRTIRLLKLHFAEELTA